MKNREPPAGGERFSPVGAATRSELATERVGATEQMRPEFVGFYRATYRDVARALAVTLGDIDLASEAADEAMARCHARWATVQSYENPSGWAYRVGLNWARSRVRRAARAPAFDRPRPVELPDVADPEIGHALRQLSVEVRAVVVCRLLFDWSTEETAEVLGIRPGTVKSRLHRALGKLERKLQHLR
jgi:RNA polymerase sigma-70 factor (ECF subfamily)